MSLTSALKVVVTGANGQVGYQLVQSLQAKVTLKAYDRSALDITDFNSLDQELSQFKPDIIINAAAYTAVDKAEQEVALANEINHFGPLHLAKIAQKLGAALIHISTDYVFDGESTIPYNESDLTSAQSIYGKTKLDGEIAVQNHCQRHIILRTSWVFGEHGNNFVKTMLCLSQHHSELNVVADQHGGPTYSGDIANTIAGICAHIATNLETPWGVYHYGGLPYVSWHEFAECIFDKAFEYGLINSIPLVNSIETKDYPTAAKRPHYSKLDCNAVMKAFNIAPSNWKSALDNLANYK